MGDGEVESPIHIHFVHPIQGAAGSPKRHPFQDPAQHQEDLHRAELMAGRDQLEGRVGPDVIAGSARGDCSSSLLHSARSSLSLPFQGLRLGPPSIARAAQVPHFGAKGFDPLLQRLVLLLPTIPALLERAPALAKGCDTMGIPVAARTCMCGSIRKRGLLPTPDESATDFADFASPITAEKRIIFICPG